MKIIAIGNAFRGDDAAGLAVAEELRSRGIDVSIASGEGTDLMERWRDADEVVVIDAVRSNGIPGTIHRIDARVSVLPSDFFHYSTHAFGVAEAVELARALGELPSSLVVYGIEGEGFEIGSSLSRAVEVAVSEVVDRVAAEVRTPVPCG